VEGITRSWSTKTGNPEWSPAIAAGVAAAEALIPLLSHLSTTI